MIQSKLWQPFPFFIFFAFLIFLFPARIEAAEIDVPESYPTIQSAINAAASGDSVVVDPGVYEETLTLKDNIEIRGRETARTFLSSGGGAGPIISVSSSLTATIRNFTFVSSAVGLQISNNSSIFNIYNNVFQVGTSGTAIVVKNSPLVNIVNNAFYENGTAVSPDSDIVIENNIFYGSQLIAIGGTSVSSFNVAYNDFFNNVNTGPTGTNAVLGDPLFAAPANHDFHLQENSPCIDAGDPGSGLDIIDDTLNDIGAYGGPFADAIPFPVSGLTIVSTTNTSINLSWLPNNSYLVTNSIFPGGYALYYGYASGTYNGTDADSGTSPSPIDVGPFTTYTLLDLNPAARGVPATPVLNPLIPQNGQLAVSWSAVANATGYKVHYGITSPGENSIDVQNNTTYTITGLTNGQPYRVAVSSYDLPTYYIVVAAYDILNIALSSSPSATDHESGPSNEVSVQLGSLIESGLSNIQIDYPDFVTPYPALPGGKSCFIATAAYGSPSAPEVAALRNFRDAYLMTSLPGRLLVRWYYAHGPAAAALLNAHPAFKPLVRAALLPAVCMAIFLTQTPPMLKAGVLMIIGFAAFYVFTRKQRSAPRGSVD